MRPRQSLQAQRSTPFILVLLLVFLFLLPPTTAFAEMTHATTDPAEQPADPQQTQQADAAESNDSAPLGLPDPQSASANAVKVDLSNGAADLSDVLGPIVINTDGSTARITNWQDMTPEERERTLRVITRRNRQRMERLKKEEL